MTQFWWQIIIRSNLVQDKNIWKNELDIRFIITWFLRNLGTCFCAALQCWVTCFLRKPWCMLHSIQFVKFIVASQLFSSHSRWCYDRLLAANPFWRFLMGLPDSPLNVNGFCLPKRVVAFWHDNNNLKNLRIHFHAFFTLSRPIFGIERWLFLPNKHHNHRLWLMKKYWRVN